MEFGEIIFYLVIALIALRFIVKFFNLLFLPSKAEKEYEKKLQESLKDEFIIDPETGAKLTLEQAQSGHWIAHDNEFKTLADSEIEKLVTEEEKKVEICTNYLKESKEYKKHKLTDKQIHTLENTKILSKYDNWTYSQCFNTEFADGLVLLASVVINDKTPGYYSTTYIEPQVLFWLNFDFDMGHYYLREKSNVEKFLDLIKKDDELQLNNYESFTIRKSHNIIKIIKILEKFENQNRIEIEFMDTNLFVKNEKLATIEEVTRLESIIKSI
jgi:hypothetical protein